MGLTPEEWGISPPQDYALPDWATAGTVYDWRRYVPDELQRIWPSLSLDARAAAAITAHALAAEWDSPEGPGAPDGVERRKHPTPERGKGGRFKKT